MLEIETYQAREPTFDAATKGKGKVGTTLRVVVGDDSGAEASLEVPLRKAYANIMEGDPVLAVVVSDSAELDRFR